MPIGVYKRLPADQRFERRIDRSGECHLWTGPLASTGYPNFLFEGRYIGAHVFAWMQVHGPVPKGLVVRHSCRRRHCVRIEHLSIGTQRQNNHDMIRDGVWAHGETCGKAKLTEDNIREAKKLRDLGVPWTVLGRKYGVTGTAIARAVTHVTWKHVVL